MARITFASSDYVRPKKIDWSQVFEDLKNHGLSPYRLEELTGYTASTIQRWAQGTEPKDSAANCILQIHTNFCGNERTRQIRMSAIEISC